MNQIISAEATGAGQAETAIASAATRQNFPPAWNSARFR
jgi:hypothetical protein